MYNFTHALCFWTRVIVYDLCKWIVLCHTRFKQTADENESSVGISVWKIRANFCNWSSVSRTGFEKNRGLKIISFVYCCRVQTGKKLLTWLPREHKVSKMFVFSKHPRGTIDEQYFMRSERQNRMKPRVRDCFRFCGAFGDYRLFSRRCISSDNKLWRPL